MRLLATLLGALGQYAETEELMRAVLEAERRTIGPSHANTLRTASLLALYASSCFFIEVSLSFFCVIFFLS